MAVPELPRPGVEVIQEFRSAAPTIVAPTLVPCNVAPFFEIVEVLNTDGTVNDDAQVLSLYDQLGVTVDQSSFPSPRDNIDEVDVLEDTIRVFFLYGGSLLELSRETGFLASLNDLSTTPHCEGSTANHADAAGPFNAGKSNILDGKYLVLSIDAHGELGIVATPPLSTSKMTIQFVGESLSMDEVIEQVNAVISTVATASKGTNNCLRITSRASGVSSSVYVWSGVAGGTANEFLGLDVSKDEIAVGAGLYATDDGDGDLQSPRIEHYTGTTQRDIDAIANVPATTAADFTSHHIEPDDVLICDGTNIGEVYQVFTDRLVMDVEQNLFTADTPFAPKYCWVQAQNLVSPAPASTTAAEMAGTGVAAAASVPFIVGQAAFAATVASESLTLDHNVDGVAQPTEVVGVDVGGWANVAAAVSAIDTVLGGTHNIQVYQANQFGVEDTSNGTFLAFRLKAGLTGSGTSLTLTSQSSGMNSGFSSLPVADVGENVRYLAGRPILTSVDWTGLGGSRAIGELIAVDVVKDGGTAVTEEHAWAAAHTPDAAGLLTAIADWNTDATLTEAYRSDATGAVDAAGDYFSIKSIGEIFGTTSSITTVASTGTDDLDVFGALGATAAGDVGLHGQIFKWKTDSNPTQREALFVADEDDGGVSLQQVLDEINELTPGVASENPATPRTVLLTSTMAGEGSSIAVQAGTANTILGFGNNTEEVGTGRPLPDLVIDANGAAVIQNQILRNGLTGVPYPATSSQVYISYKGLRLDLSPEAQDPSLLTFDDVSVLEEVAGPISSDNPGCLMTYLTLINSPGQSVTAIGVPNISADAPDGTPIGYTKCFQFLESEEVYGIAVGTHQTVVHQAGITHCNFMSEPENKGERILFFNPEVPTRRVPTLINSGNDANTSSTAGKVTVEENVAEELIRQGLDPASLNPATGPIENEVYLDLGLDDNYYLLWKVENGNELYIRTAFESGDGNEDAFYATSNPSGIISDTWTVAIRGSELLLPGTDLVDKQALAETLQQIGQGYSERRAFYAFPDRVGINVTGTEQVVSGYYATSCIIGMVGNLPPQQGFTNYPITGLTRVLDSGDYFRNSQLNAIAYGGIYILFQEADGAPVICRHQVSTDTSSIEARELSITKVVDFTAKFMRGALRTFIGRSNITQSFLDQLSSVVQGVLSFLIETGVLIGGDVNNVIQDADAPDTVLIDVTLDVPYPANYIRVTLVI